MNSDVNFLDKRMAFDKKMPTRGAQQACCCRLDKLENFEPKLMASRTNQNPFSNQPRKDNTMKLLLSSITATALSVAAVQAQVQIINDNFDELTQGANLAAWSGGNIANNTVTAQPVGVGGSLGVEWQVDFLQQWNGYQAYQWQSAGITGNTSANPGDYTVSFDLDVVGPTAFNNLQLNVQAANSWGGPWGGTGAAGVPLSATLGWQHISLALNNAIWTSDALTPQGSIWQLQFQINGWDLVGGGPQNGEQVVLDNVLVTMVPEPGTFALAGLGLATLLIFRRRR